MKGLFVSGKAVINIYFFAGVIIKLESKTVGSFRSQGNAVTKCHIKGFRERIADFLILAFKDKIQCAVFVHAVFRTVRGTVEHIVEVICSLNGCGAGIDFGRHHLYLNLIELCGNVGSFSQQHYTELGNGTV